MAGVEFRETPFSQGMGDFTSLLQQILSQYLGGSFDLDEMASEEENKSLDSLLPLQENVDYTQLSPMGSARDMSSLGGLGSGMMDSNSQMLYSPLMSILGGQEGMVGEGSDDIMNLLTGLMGSQYAR